jgi:hypothetical protein
MMIIGRLRSSVDDDPQSMTIVVDDDLRSIAIVGR